MNILALGGSIDAHKIWLLATNIWTLEELSTQCIDSKRTAKETSRFSGRIDPDKTDF